jgi:hypothetical protein
MEFSERADFFGDRKKRLGAVLRETEAKLSAELNEMQNR